MIALAPDHWKLKNSSTQAFPLPLASWIGHQSIHLTKKKYWHPLLAESFQGIRNQTTLLEPKIAQKLTTRAFYLITLVIRSGGHLLVVNTNPDYSPLVRNLRTLAEDSSWHFGPSPLSFSAFKWVGGTLTNWKQVSKSVLTFAKFSQKCRGFLKKNALEFPRYKKVDTWFQGFFTHYQGKSHLAFSEKPDILFIFNPNENSHLIREAEKFHIPIVAFVESNTSCKSISYPIPLNSYSMEMVYYYLKKLFSISHLNCQN